MTFVISKYSKSQVNKAGKILVSPDDYAPDEVANAIEVLTNWRTAHAYPINTFQATLREKVKLIDRNALVAQRLKRAPSIIGKLSRIDKMQLARMQDIGGIRAVLSTMAQVRKLEGTYRSGRLKHRLVRRDDYIDAPKEDGYRSLHLVYSYKNNNAPTYEGLHVELQLRTSLQHSWATAVETMGTFIGKSIKSGEGDGKWKEFFLATSAGFAIREGLPVPAVYEGVGQSELYERIADIERDLDVLTTLGGFSIAADNIKTEKGHGAYHLVVLDTMTRKVTITPYASRVIERAGAEYTEVEKRTSGANKIEAVLVSAGPVAALKRAYPNYFLDTHVFIREVKRMIKDGVKAARERRGKVYAAKRREPSQDIDFARERRGKVYAAKRREPSQDIDFKPFAWITSREIPQADDIDSIRTVLNAIDSGATKVEIISECTGISARHVHYKLLAAEILGCVRGGTEKALTATGRSWLRREQGSEEEAGFLRNIIEDTAFYQLVVPDLFEAVPPSNQAIANRIMSLCDVSEQTANRRASSLKAWSNRLRQCMLQV